MIFAYLFILLKTNFNRENMVDAADVVPFHSFKILKANL